MDSFRDDSILFDHSSLSEELRPCLAGFIDALVMNAGGSGGKTPLALTEDGVTDLFASNILGHMALMEGCIDTGQLTQATVYVESEAARGFLIGRVPSLLSLDCLQA